MLSTLTDISIRHWGLADYVNVWEAMQDFTNQRHETTPDEIWVVEHPPVFTQGQNGKAEHLLHVGDIPVVHVDRGGQVTYHGPGQVVIYPLIDIARRGLAVRPFVTLIEQTMITVLAEYGILAQARTEAPGVYVGDEKIASLGLRIRQGRSYHGLAFNVKMDLEPFARINPCGLRGMKMTQLVNFVPDIKPAIIADKLSQGLIQAISRSIS